MRKLHERIELERQYKTELETIQEKSEKIVMERQMIKNREEEYARRKE